MVYCVRLSVCVSFRIVTISIVTLLLYFILVSLILLCAPRSNCDATEICIQFIFSQCQFCRFALFVVSVSMAFSSMGFDNARARARKHTTHEWGAANVLVVDLMSKWWIVREKHIPFWMYIHLCVHIPSFFVSWTFSFIFGFWVLVAATPYTHYMKFTEHRLAHGKKQNKPFK